MFILFCVVVLGIPLVIFSYMVKELIQDLYLAEYGPCYCGSVGRYIGTGNHSDMAHYRCAEHQINISNSKIISDKPRNLRTGKTVTTNGFNKIGLNRTDTRKDILTNDLIKTLMKS